jgi:hypothetical protein
LSIRSDKNKVVLTYLGDGVVAFEVPLLPAGAPVHLCFKKKGTGNGIGPLFTGRNLIFRDMIRNAFCKQGGITLQGYLPPFTGTNRDLLMFRTVIQPDADLLCQIDMNVLKKSNYHQLLCGYDLVGHQFLKAFHNHIHFLRLKILSLLGAGSGFAWVMVKWLANTG